MIGVFVQHGDVLDLNSLYDIAQEFSSAGQAVAIRKQGRDSDNSDSESSSSETGIFCQSCRAKWQKLGPTSIHDPEMLRVGRGLVKETRLLAEVRNEQLRLVCLSDLLDKRLHDFVNIKFTAPCQPKKKRCNKTQHSTTSSVRHSALSTSIPTLPPNNSLLSLRRSPQIALQQVKNK